MSFKRKVHHALSSDARAETLQLLYKKPHDIDQIAKKLKLQPVTVRHHIQTLKEAGILEENEERTGQAGRPKVYYKIAQNIPIVTFPARYYQDLTKRIIKVMFRKFGKEKTQDMLGDLGQEMAKDTVAFLKATNNIKHWNPNNLVDIYVNRYLVEMGTEPELVQKTQDKVVYKLHNCIFAELSKEYPDFICDVIHRWFSESFAKNLGENIQITQTSCMGHGCQFCEQVIQWQPKKT